MNFEPADQSSFEQLKLYLLAFTTKSHLYSKKNVNEVGIIYPPNN